MLALCQSFECPRAVLLPLAQPRLAVAYPAKLVLFVSGVTSAPPSLLSSEHLPLLMFRKCCFVIDRTSCCGFVTRGSKFTFGDLPLFPTSQDHQLLILPQYTCPTTTRRHVLSVHCKCGRKCVFARHTTCWDRAQCKDDWQQATDPTRERKNQNCTCHGEEDLLPV